MLFKLFYSFAHNLFCSLEQHIKRSLTDPRLKLAAPRATLLSAFGFAAVIYTQHFFSVKDSGHSSSNQALLQPQESYAVPNFFVSDRRVRASTLNK